ncbi:MAG: hypothetical protein WDZ77_01605 [Candidatus Pacearchaeota archaeon]
MFNKKKCKRCGEGVNSKYLFCPHCGNLCDKKSKKDSGMLGEDDLLNGLEDIQNSLFGGVGGKVVGKMFENAIKMLEKEMQKEANKQNHQEPKSNFQLFINGKRIDNPNPKKTTKKKKHEIKEEFMDLELPQNNLEGFSELPKNEPRTNVRRFSDKVIYEINIPGVKSLKDISITRLENNIEIRARTKNKAYTKIIPISFPIIDYNFSKGKLLIELDSKE